MIKLSSISASPVKSRILSVIRKPGFASDEAVTLAELHKLFVQNQIIGSGNTAFVPENPPKNLLERLLIRFLRPHDAIDHILLGAQATSFEQERVAFFNSFAIELMLLSGKTPSYRRVKKLLVGYVRLFETVLKNNLKRDNLSPLPEREIEQLWNSAVQAYKLAVQAGIKFPRSRVLLMFSKRRMEQFLEQTIPNGLPE